MSDIVLILLFVILADCLFLFGHFAMSKFKENIREHEMIQADIELLGESIITVANNINHTTSQLAEELIEECIDDVNVQ